MRSVKTIRFYIQFSLWIWGRLGAPWALGFNPSLTAAISRAIQAKQTRTLLWCCGLTGVIPPHSLTLFCYSSDSLSFTLLFFSFHLLPFCLLCVLETHKVFEVMSLRDLRFVCALRLRCVDIWDQMSVPSALRWTGPGPFCYFLISESTDLHASCEKVPLSNHFPKSERCRGQIPGQGCQWSEVFCNSTQKRNCCCRLMWI